jgi:hypothetical protein
VGLDELTGQTIAWSQTFPGGGAALVLGLRWSHAMREHERMLTALLRQLGLYQIVRGSNPNIWTSLWRTSERQGLFVLNLLTSPMQTHIQVQLKPDAPLIDTGLHALGPISVKWIEINQS